MNDQDLPARSPVSSRDGLDTRSLGRVAGRGIVPEETMRFSMIALLAIAALACVSALPAEPSRVGQELAPFAATQPVVSDDCGDSVDLLWRCVVAPPTRFAQELQHLEDACFDPATISASPWAHDPATGEVTFYVYYGRIDPNCVIE